MLLLFYNQIYVISLFHELLLFSIKNDAHVISRANVNQTLYEGTLHVI